jgi:hypothetical protein
MKPSRNSLAFVVQLGLVGLLFAAVAPPADTAGPPKAEAVVNAKHFHERLLKIAEIYHVYGRVDDEARWSPTFCRMPQPAQAHYSNSSDEATHGQKLYSLFARDRAAYVGNKNPGGVGQVIVKESWIPLEVARKPKVERLPAPEVRKGKLIEPPRDLAPIGGLAAFTNESTFHPFAEKAGKWYKAERRGDMFIMMKLDPKTAGADDGWVYGTVSADGKTVTSAGRVASCMKCHETRATRLFGLKRPEEKKVKP